jgi:hypothetical protein
MYKQEYNCTIGEGKYPVMPTKLCSPGYNGVPVIAINNYEEVIKLNALPVHNVFEGSIHMNIT